MLIGVETKPPYAVTVFELTEDAIAQGRKMCAIWLERLRASEENDFWPTYAQAPVPFDLPPWMSTGDDEDADDDASEDAAQ